MRLQNYYIELLRKNGLLKDALHEAGIRYAMSALTSELVKTLLLIFIFYLLGALPQFLWVLVMLTPIRMSTGGFHFHTNIKCFSFSLFFYLCTVIFAPQVAISEQFSTILLMLSVALILVLPLYPSKKRPIISHKKYVLNKALSTVFVLLVTGIILAEIPDLILIRCFIWTLFFQSLQLLYLYVFGVLSPKTHQKEEFSYVK